MEVRCPAFRARPSAARKSLSATCQATLHRNPHMIVFVTGASAGFGAAIARAFVKGGHRVVATARRKDRLQALADELGDALLPYELDVRDRAAVEAVPASLPADFAALDVLVN